VEDLRRPWHFVPPVTEFYLFPDKQTGVHRDLLPGFEDRISCLRVLGVKMVARANEFQMLTGGKLSLSKQSLRRDLEVCRGLGIDCLVCRAGGMGGRDWEEVRSEIQDSLRYILAGKSGSPILLVEVFEDDRYAGNVGRMQEVLRSVRDLKPLGVRMDIGEAISRWTSRDPRSWLWQERLKMFRYRYEGKVSDEVVEVLSSCNLPVSLDTAFDEGMGRVNLWRLVEILRNRLREVSGL